MKVSMLLFPYISPSPPFSPLLLLFKGSSNTVLQTIVLIYISTIFSLPSPAFIVCRFYDHGLSDWCEVLFEKKELINLLGVFFFPSISLPWN